jgi:hypothetical protein
MLRKFIKNFRRDAKLRVDDIKYRHPPHHLRIPTSPPSSSCIVTPSSATLGATRRRDLHNQAGQHERIAAAVIGH